MGPSGWEFTPRCPDWNPEPEPGSAQAANQARALEVAAFVLWALTGRVFGVRADTIRPCFRPPDPRQTTYRGRGVGAAGLISWPGLISGTWVNGPCGCRSEHCGCLIPYTMLALPAPIVSVTEVRVDGQVFDPAGYRIKDNRWLVRVDGQHWPHEQNLEAADTQPGAFVVSWTHGVPLPAAGQDAAGDLACELLRGMTGGACALPSRAVSVSRQGVDVQLLDPAQYLDAGLTGIPSVDAFIKAVNPGKARSRPKVYNPDTMGRLNRMRAGNS